MKTDLNAGRAEFLDTEIISAERPGQISSRAEMPADEIQDQFRFVPDDGKS